VRESVTTGRRGAGSYLIKPRGLMHTFRNACPGSARLFEVIASEFRDLLRRTRRGPRPRAGVAAGSEIRGDLLIGLGRRADLQVRPKVTRSITRYPISNIPFYAR
jgi:hypothetical protein